MSRSESTDVVYWGNDNDNPIVADWDDGPKVKSRRCASRAAHALLDAAPMPPQAVILAYLRKGSAAPCEDTLVPQSLWSRLPPWMFCCEARGKHIICWEGHCLVPADADEWSTCNMCGLRPIPSGSPILWCEICAGSCICATCAALPRIPLLQDDFLFRGRDDPCLLEWGAHNQECYGTVVICPGGNYEFLCSNEALPASRWFAKNGIYAVVLRYRLLPKYNGDDALDDLAIAIEHLRQSRKGPVVAIGFSAGAHLCAGLSVRPAGEKGKPVLLDGQILVYPAIDGSDWLEWSTCGWFDKPGCLVVANSLTRRQDSLLGGIGFDAPPSFVVSSTTDKTCPPADHSDVYVRALISKNVPHVYIRRDLGDHGFSLEGDWTSECIAWVKSFGIGIGGNGRCRDLADAEHSTK